MLCGINLASTTAEIHFDDFFTLNVNNVIVAGSQVLANAISEDQVGFKNWDWSEVVNRKMEDLGKYCLSGSCSLPEHDTPGAFDIDLAFDNESTDSTLLALMAKIKNENRIVVEAIATGDNDNGDCYHSGGDFELELQILDL